MSSESITIRSALPQELPSIVEACVSAFTTFDVFGPPWFSDAGLLPAVLGAMPEADPRLSRVALDEKTGDIVGHALWNPCTMYFAGRERRAASLAPISVRASHQGRGIGGQLMRDGIELLRSFGFEILVLFGHETYYPRFGLVPGCLGSRSSMVVTPAALNEDPDGYRLRPFACGDERELSRLWREGYAGIDGAVDPGPGSLPWISKLKGIVSCTLERKGAIVGHARFNARPETPPEAAILRFLAADAEAARVLLGRIAAWTGMTTDEVRLPVPIEAARWFADAKPHHEWWQAGMAMALGEDADLRVELERIAAKEAPPLAVEWPPVFDT